MTYPLLKSVIQLLTKESIKKKSQRLIDCGSWATGSGFPPRYQGLDDQEILFSKISDMNLPNNKKFMQRTNNTISRKTAEEIKVKIHPSGTVIFPKIGGAIATNKRKILIKDTAIDNNCLGIIPNNNTNSEWLYYTLLGIEFQKYQSGTSVPALRQSVLAEIKIPKINLEEQKRIVKILYCYESIVKNNEENQKYIEKLREAVLSEAFQSKLVLQSKDYPPKKTKKGWEEKTIQSVCKEKIQSGGTPLSKNSEYYEKGTIPWVITADMTEAGMYINKTKKKITQTGYNNSNARMFPKSTILFSMYGSIGKTCITKIELCTNQAILGIIPDNSIVLTKYLYYCLQRLTNEFIEMGRGCAQSNINAKMVKEYTIQVPPVSVQEAIIKKIDAFFKEYEILKKENEYIQHNIISLQKSVLKGTFEVKT